MRTLVRGWSAAKRITRCSVANPSRVTRNCLVPGGRYRMVTGVTPQPMPSIVTCAPAGWVTISSTGTGTGAAGGCSLVAAVSLDVTLRGDSFVPDVAAGAAGSKVTAGAASLFPVVAPSPLAAAVTG